MVEKRTDDPNFHILRGAPIPRPLFRRICDTVKDLAELRPQPISWGESPLWAEAATKEVNLLPDQTIGIRTRIGDDIQSGQIDVNWFHDSSRRLIVKALDEGSPGATSLPGYIEFHKQNDDSVRLNGEVYLKTYGVTEGSHEIAVNLRCRGEGIDPLGNLFHEYYGFAEKLGLGGLWEKAEQAGLAREQTLSGEMDISRSRRMANALHELLKAERPRP